MTLESILDNDETVISKINQEARSLIYDWVIDNIWVGTKRSYRTVDPADFEIDNNNYINFNGREVEDVTLNLCTNIPEYIRFSYVSKSFKSIKSTYINQDASFLLQHLSSQGIRDLKTIIIRDTNIKTLGDLSRFKCDVVIFKDNKYLDIKPSQLPHVDIGFVYTNNHNELKLNDIKNKFLYHGKTVLASVELDNFTNANK